MLLRPVGTYESFVVQVDFSRICCIYARNEPKEIEIFLDYKFFPCVGLQDYCLQSNGFLKIQRNKLTEEEAHYRWSNIKNLISWANVQKCSEVKNY